MSVRSYTDMIKIILLPLLLLFSVSAFSMTIADVTLSEELDSTQETPNLKLNGAALRELYLLVETYVGALYLETPSHNPQVILNSEQHKRMEFHILMKKISARRLSKALHEALLLNINEEEHHRLKANIETMLSYFEGNLRAGDKVVFQYTPSVGTKVSIGDDTKGIIPGRDFHTAILKIWLGESPVSREFKEHILGMNI